ncbi:MAG: hypothetical protein IKP45_05620 [Bacteroidales bacterium]|nr:hypothetical protein [Bacteroidales bacterium]
MAYGFNLNGFQDKDFVNQLHEMTGEFFAEGRTIDLIENQPGNKNKDSLNMFSNNITVQSGEGCGFNPEGDVALVQKYVEVKPLKVNDKICYKDLEKTYLGMYMKNTEIPFERQLAESYVGKVRRFNEIFIWDGDADYKGLAKQIGESADVIDASAEVETAATKIAKVNALISKATADILESDDVRIFCTTSFYMGYIQELIAANLYIMPQVYNMGDKMKMEMLIPSTNIIITPVLGLDHLTNTTIDDGDALVLTYSKNLVASYDGLNDEERFDMIVNPYDGNNLYVTMEWKIGSAFKWDNKIVKGYTVVSES